MSYWSLLQFQFVCFLSSSQEPGNIMQFLKLLWDFPEVLCSQVHKYFSLSTLKHFKKSFCCFICYKSQLSFFLFRSISVPKNASKEFKWIQFWVHWIDADRRWASDSRQSKAVRQAHFRHRRWTWQYGKFRWLELNQTLKFYSFSSIEPTIKLSFL